MGRFLPIELRERAVSLVEHGHTHRAAAAQLDVSVKFVNDMVKLKRETGGLTPRKQGTRAPGKLAPVTDWVRERVAQKADITLAQLAQELEVQHGLCVSEVSIWRLLKRLGLSHKKNATRI